ncbi:GntR family transcriptional regulator [Saccharomonospora azurea]|uniref:Transcriptional regulator n=1 Tax=Saccharomonospora azurea NA-128 TaxID=882081 RepID=H8G5Y6_9PSEU|nr:GntR family transcriptional regulator [Saccharomonospora azurea]EHK88672.1 GntR family transcriptional regulator [Saccharomonospora azurea SZMC 14600]EHY91263.1 transcriptional regulator [Saccharomonospora azurea NA-128]
MLDRTDGRPLHQQVAESLRQEIVGHDLPPGSTLPSEAELCARFGVGRSVVRQAVAGLAADGLVIRRQGRPTVVAEPTEYRRLVQRATGLFDQFARRGHDIRTTVVGLEKATPPAPARASLGTSACLKLERIRLVDDEPLSYVRTWLPAARVSELDADDLVDASLHRLLSQRYGLRPVSGQRQVRAVAADERLAAALDIGVGTPLLLLEGETADQHGRPLEWFSAWHRADRVVFDIDVSETAETLTLDAASPREPAGAPTGRSRPTSEDLARARELVEELRTLLD